MARRGRAAHFQGAGDIIIGMLVLIGTVGAIVFALSPLSPRPNPLLAESFSANPLLNGGILAALAFGIYYVVTHTAGIGRAGQWIKAYDDAGTARHRKLPSPPSLIRPVSVLLRRHEADGGGLFGQPAATAILDSVGVQIDEAREVSRYVAGLLVFLGLLGTFWGLLQTVSGIADVIGNLSSDTGDGADAVSQLIGNLNEPLSGMYTAFSSSLFGLGGSLVIGALDLLNGRALNRFYADLEAWLADNTMNAPGRGAASGAFEAGGKIAPGEAQRLEAAITALAASQDRGAAGVRQEIRDLGRLIGGAPDGR